MVKVSNGKTIRRLAKKSLKAAKLRNIAAVCAIALTTILFTTLFTIGLGTLETFERVTMRQVGTDSHGIIKYIDDATFEKIKTHPLIREISYNRILCDSVDNPELLKRPGELWYHDENALKHNFSQPTTGTMPLRENELMADTKTLQLLGVPLEIGAPVSLELTVKGNQVKRNFVLSGWYEPDVVLNRSQLITSQAYVDKYQSELKSEFYENSIMTGSINAEIMFNNSADLENKLNTVLLESGFEIYDESSPNYLLSNVNWGYLSTNIQLDLSTIIGFACAGIVIIFTGYLIIYNIFQISVIRDIRFYGLLKTIGTTGKQLYRIILDQALTLSVIGIPIGLICGFYVGKSLVPLVIQQSFYAGTQVIVTTNPVIFIGSVLFALLTIWISTRKPGKIASSVSPVEATHYIEQFFQPKKQVKKTSNGGKLYKMAFANVGRNKKRAVLVLISLSLSLVLLNTVFTVTQGFDMDKYLAKFVDTDFEFFHASLNNSNFHGLEDSVAEDEIAMLKTQPGYEDGGRIYFSLEEPFSIEDPAYTHEYNRLEDGNPLAAVHGMDDFVFNRIEIVEGELDLEQLKTGNYILEGVHTDDYGNPLLEQSPNQIGDKLVFHNYYLNDDQVLERGTREFQLMGKFIIKNTMYSGVWYNRSFYLPSDIYCSLITNDPIMRYIFDVADEAEDDYDGFLADYTQNVDPVMDYNSKKSAQADFSSLQSMILIIGGVLSFIIGLIGILNFANSILTSIIARRKEFAMLESIGMTKAQLKKILCYEGLYYALGTIVISFSLGVLASCLIVKGVVASLWFFSYKFVISPLLICWPIMILIAILIPLLAFSGTMKDSVVHRLRETE